MTLTNETTTTRTISTTRRRDRDRGRFLVRPQGPLVEAEQHHHGRHQRLGARARHGDVPRDAGHSGAAAGRSQPAQRSAVDVGGQRLGTRSNATAATASRRAGDGRTLTIGGTTYAKGLGTHAASDITYHLGGTCRSFSVDVGVDDESTAGGSVVFRIYRDGALVADSGVRHSERSAHAAERRPHRRYETAARRHGRRRRHQLRPRRLGQRPAGLRQRPRRRDARGQRPVVDFGGRRLGTGRTRPSNGEQAAGDGRTLTIGGTTYAKGLGTHAVQRHHVLPRRRLLHPHRERRRRRRVGRHERLRGLPGSTGTGPRWPTAAGSPEPTLAKALTADLSGGLEVRLVVTDSGDGVDYDHADWAVPRLSCG